MTSLLVLGLILRLGVDVAVNRWNRWFFDALERRDAYSASVAVAAFAGLVMCIAAVGVLIVVTRERLQVRWREWFTAKLLDRWLARRAFYRLGLNSADVANPEYRISDDVRMATEPLVDFAIGLFTALLAFVTFIGILWSVGGSYRIGSGEGAGDKFRPYGAGRPRLRHPSPPSWCPWSGAASPRRRGQERGRGAVPLADDPVAGETPSRSRWPVE